MPTKIRQDKKGHSAVAKPQVFQVKARCEVQKLQMHFGTTMSIKVSKLATATGIQYSECHELFLSELEACCVNGKIR